MFLLLCSLTYGYVLIFNAVVMSLLTKDSFKPKKGQKGGIKREKKSLNLIEIEI